MNCTNTIVFLLDKAAHIIDTKRDLQLIHDQLGLTLNDQVCCPMYKVLTVSLLSKNICNRHQIACISNVWAICHKK